MATSRAAELDSPPPRGTELTTTALKPGRGAAAGETMVMVRWAAWGDGHREGMYFGMKGVNCLVTVSRDVSHVAKASNLLGQGAHSPPSFHPEAPGPPQSS